MGDVTKLRSKRHDVIVEALQLVLDFGDHYGLDQHTKDGLAGALGKVAPPEKWAFVMLNPTQQRLVLKAIKASPRPLATMAIWQAAISFIAYDRDGEIMADRETLAEAAGIRPQETTKALSQLVEIGALLKLRRGRYAINPHVGWSGSVLKREQQAAVNKPVQLSLFEGGKEARP